MSKVYLCARELCGARDGIRRTLEVDVNRWPDKCGVGKNGYCNLYSLGLISLFI